MYLASYKPSTLWIKPPPTSKSLCLRQATYLRLSFFLNTYLMVLPLWVLQIAFQRMQRCPHCTLQPQLKKKHEYLVCLFRHHNEWTVNRIVKIKLTTIILSDWNILKQITYKSTWYRRATDSLFSDKSYDCVLCVTCVHAFVSLISFGVDIVIIGDPL